MPDFTAPALPATTLPADHLLRAVLNVCLTPINLLRPLYAADGHELTDFALDYFNPAAQRLSGLAEQPGVTLRGQYPGTFANGVFAFYRQVFETGVAGRYDFHYLADGFDNYYQVAAERHGEQLVVSSFELTEQPRTAAAQVLHHNQTHELQAHMAAAVQQATLADVLAQTPVAMAVLSGPTHIVALANPRMEEIWGRSVVPLLGRPHFEALPDLAGQGFEAIFAAVYSTGQPYHLHEQLVSINRADTDRLTTGYFNIAYQPLRNGQGHITGIVASAIEVTAQVAARRQVEQFNENLEMRVTARSAETRAALFEAEQQREQLRAQQALLGQILKQVPAAIATLSGSDHRYTFFNEPYQTISAGRVGLGRTVAEVLPELQEQGFINLLDQVYSTGQPFLGTDMAVMLYDQATGQAEQRYVDFVYQPLFDSQQRTAGILAFMVDVTEKVRSRKHADMLQAAMLAAVKRQGQERENVFQLFEQAPAIICLLRAPNHRIDYLNPAYQALFPGRVLLGHTLAEIQPDNQALVAQLDRIYQQGQPVFQPEVPVAVPQPQGQPPRTRYFDFTYQAYREDGRIAGVSIFGFDVTDQVRVRQQVQELNQELAAINEELQATNQQLHDTNTRLTRTNADLDTFVYTASHDLKAPIANIEGLLMALRSDLPAELLQDALVPRLLDLMQSSVERFQQTIGHLTDIAQLQQPEATETVDLNVLVQDVCLDLAPLIEAAHAALTIAVSGRTVVRVAPKTLRSVVYNLLSNAIKYRSPDRPAQVALRGYCSASLVTLEVQDNGLGLSIEQQAQLFGMFRRLHNHVEGSGVGLFMVKRLIENAGGTIVVHSRLGEGTTFTVSLPA